jgi:hypothetical protein
MPSCILKRFNLAVCQVFLCRFNLIANNQSSKPILLITNKILLAHQWSGKAQGKKCVAVYNTVHPALTQKLSTFLDFEKFLKYKELRSKFAIKLRNSLIILLNNPPKCILNMPKPFFRHSSPHLGRCHSNFQPHQLFLEMSNKDSNRVEL